MTHDQRVEDYLRQMRDLLSRAVDAGKDHEAAEAFVARASIKLSIAIHLQRHVIPLPQARKKNEHKGRSDREVEASSA